MPTQRDLKLFRTRGGDVACDKDGMVTATAELKRLLKIADVEFASEKLYDAIARGVVRGYIKIVSAKVPIPPGNINPITLQLCQMEVGDEIEVDAKCGQTIRAYMKSARKRMGSDGLRWHQFERGGKTIVRRVEDNARPERDPMDNPKALWLASLTVGESKYPPDGLFDPMRSMQKHAKMQADKIIHRQYPTSPPATWTQKRVMVNGELKLRIKRRT